MAGTGPMPMMLGSTPYTPYDTMRASGLRQWRLTAASLATNMAPAPSLMPDALPAVTTPSFLKTGGSFARVSIVVSATRTPPLIDGWMDGWIRA